MKTFKEFINQSQTQPMGGVASNPTEKWKASKKQILYYWKNLRADTPIQASAIAYSHKGSTYGEDGIRITGTPQFIGTVLARLKELINYEGSSTKLSLTYRETESPSQLNMGLAKSSFVFYVSVRERGKS